MHSGWQEHRFWFSRESPQKFIYTIKPHPMRNFHIFLLSLSLLFLNTIVRAQACPDSVSILHYIFSGDATDLSGNGYDGQIVGPLSAPDRFGKPDGALAFNGIFDYVLTGYEPDLGTDDFSIEIWFNAASISASPGNRLISKGVAMVGTPAYAGYAIKLRKENGINELRFSLGDEAGETVTAISTGIQENKWNHVVAVREENGMKVYINGQFSASFFASKIFNVDTNLPFTLGRLDRDGLAPNAEYFHGSLDLVRIYNYALTQEEIDCLYSLDSDILLDNRTPNESEGFAFYPNPVSNFLYFPEGNDPEIQIWNLSGERVLASRGEGKRVDLSHLPDGVYFLKMVTRKGSVFTRKLLKGQ
jgi:hypothetical protein